MISTIFTAAAGTVAGTARVIAIRWIGVFATPGLTRFCVLCNTLLIVLSTSGIFHKVRMSHNTRLRRTALGGTTRSRTLQLEVGIA
jgi:hypothetical protein